MGKKFVAIFVLCLTFVMCSIGFTACSIANNDRIGDNENSINTEIENVYNMYVANAEAKGESPLSYEEWFASIKGEKGEKGEKGDTGAQGIQGEKGENGKDGRGIKSVYINENDELVVVYTDDQEQVITITNNNKDDEPIENAPMVALLTLHGEDSSYDKNFIDAFIAACAKKGISSSDYRVVTNIYETDECYTAAAGLAESGCKAVFADSFGHESYLKQAAKQYPSTKFFHATGDQAHTEGLNNYYNTFAAIYEGRYLTGYAAGLKLLTMKGKAVNNNFKIGYVDAYPYAECVSARTAFYLGVKAAIAENDPSYTVSMDVSYVGSWYDFTGEKIAAESLIANGCVLISQYSDSMGAPNACDDVNVPNVAYNYSTQKSTMVAYCKINWQPYFEKMIDCALNGENIPVDYCGNLNDNSVQWYLGDNAADGTLAKLQVIEAELKNGTRQVFDCSKFTVNGAKADTSVFSKASYITMDENGHLIGYKADVDDDWTYVPDTNVIITDSETNITYFAESFYRSAPYFDILIDGITVLNSVVW